MKYMFIFITVLVVHTATAQSYTFAKIPTDTTKGISENKWAVIEIRDMMSMTGGIVVVFDNGSRVNLFQIFRADTSMVRSENTYLIASLKYMDSMGFKLISTYVTNESEHTSNRLIFQRK